MDSRNVYDVCSYENRYFFFWWFSLNQKHFIKLWYWIWSNNRNKETNRFMGSIQNCCISFIMEISRRKDFLWINLIIRRMERLINILKKLYYDIMAHPLLSVIVRVIFICFILILIAYILFYSILIAVILIPIYYIWRYFK